MEGREMSETLERIKSRLFDVEFVTKKEWWGKETTILTDDRVRQEPLIVRKAMAIDHVLNNMPVEIKPDELVVGVANMAMIGFGHVFPEYALPEEKEEAAKKSLNELSVWGHHPVRYDKLLSVGLSGVRQEVLGRIKEETSRAEPSQKKLDLYRAMIISLNAVRDLAHRYSQLTLEEALKEKDAARQRDLLDISEICSRVPELPAQTFQEALQSFWLTYAAYHSCLEYLPAGRSDQYLYPYFKKDVDEGRLTMDRARDLVGSWLAKFSERVQTRKEHWEDHYTFGDFSQGGDPTDATVNIELENDEEYNYGTSANHWLMNMILGGLTPDGKDATNELTYIILDCWGKLELVVPVMSVRFHRQSPDALYEACARIVRCGSGEPAIYNDEPIIEGLLKLGIPIEEARDYSNDGCWEVLIPGKTDFAYVHVEVLQLLEYVFTRGYSLVRDSKEGLDTGDPCSFAGFEEFYEAFRTQLYRQLDHVIDNKLRYYGEVSKIAPDPLLSALMDNCIEKGLDLTEGGAKYKFYVPIITGLSHCADSLAVVKKLVFEEKSLSMADLVDAMKSNFAERESLRQMVLNRAPKFGNDTEYVDRLASKVLADAAEKVAQRRQEIGWLTMPLAIGTFENYAKFGHSVGASADGRMARETISSNYSPSTGMDRTGPTAAIRSVVSADLLPYINGCPLDMQVNSNEVSGESGVHRLVALMKSFMELGGIILTITGASEEMLRDAKVNPDRHKGLRVRMGGLSAYFIALSDKQQDIMIERVKHGV